MSSVELASREAALDQGAVWRICGLENLAVVDRAFISFNESDRGMGTVDEAVDGGVVLGDQADDQHRGKDDTEGDPVTGLDRRPATGTGRRQVSRRWPLLAPSRLLPSWHWTAVSRASATTFSGSEPVKATDSFVMLNLSGETITTQDRVEYILSPPSFLPRNAFLLFRNIMIVGLVTRGDGQLAENHDLAGITAFRSGHVEEQ